MTETLTKKMQKLTLKPKVFLVVGMAGSGKTTFCQRLYSKISQNKCKIDKTTGLNSCIYSINLDPAVLNTKMPLNIDIKDHIDYYDVMEKHNLGPNGAITTSLNLFLMNICDVVQPKDAEYIIVDTPGQIESFTWSSPGYIIRDYFKDIGDLYMIYLVDAITSQDSSVFMSNMIYALSLICRYQVALLCTFNKTDEADSEKIERWIRDYEVFRNDLDQKEFTTPLMNTLALHFEEIYNSIDTAAVSSVTGEGVDMFLAKIDEMNSKKYKYNIGKCDIAKHDYDTSDIEINNAQ